ncbi:MAG: hypothetical protein Q9220_003217 [cf. Caloplaca sp. 1 TL-2023]
MSEPGDPEERERADYIRNATYYISMLPELRESTPVIEYCQKIPRVHDDAIHVGVITDSLIRQIQALLSAEYRDLHSRAFVHFLRENDGWRVNIENCFALLGAQMQKVSRMTKLAPEPSSDTCGKDYPADLFKNLERLVQKAREWHISLYELELTISVHRHQCTTQDWLTLETLRSRLSPLREAYARHRESVIAEALSESYHESTEDPFLRWMLSMAGYTPSFRDTHETIVDE